MNRKISNEELGRPDLERFRQLEKLPVKVVLDNVRSLNNVGSVFRTCDAFAVEELVLCGITGTPPHREILKTALGATESVAWSYAEKTDRAIIMLKEEGYLIAAVEQTVNSTMLGEWEWPNGQKLALVFGNEVSGVSQEVVNLSDLTLEIPQRGTKHSLNVAVSTGIVIWEFFKMEGRN